jgi:hypothetical protein
MAQLPDFASVGFNDPRSVSSQPQFPQEDAVATAEGQLGTAAERVGHSAMQVDAYQKMAKNHMDRAMADANFYTSTAQIDSDLKAETDPAKITALGTSYQDALQQLERAGDALLVRQVDFARPSAAVRSFCVFPTQATRLGSVRCPASGAVAEKSYRSACPRNRR